MMSRAHFYMAFAVVIGIWLYASYVKEKNRILKEIDRNLKAASDEQLERYRKFLFECKKSIIEIIIEKYARTPAEGNKEVIDALKRIEEEMAARIRQTEQPNKELWYISGAVSTDPDFRKKFSDAEQYLRTAGFNVINPVRDEEDGMPWDWYLRKDIRKLTECTGIIFLPDWKTSRGARLEKNIADGLGLDELSYDELSGRFSTEESEK